MPPNEINSDLLSHLQKRLEDALESEGGVPGESNGEGSSDSSERRTKPARTQRKLESVVYEQRVDKNQKPDVDTIDSSQQDDSEEIEESSSASQDSGLQKLMDFFQEKLSDPIYNDDDMYRRKKELYVVFEESIQRSLITTKRSQQYDDFAELTVLYFISEADRLGYTVEEIHSLVKEVS